MNSRSVQKLIDIFSKFPTIGPRTAARFVFYLIGQNKEEVNELIAGLSELKKNIKICSFCFNPFEEDGNLCHICANPGRDRSLLCVVEKETDLDSIEKTKKYHGRYFVLGGTISRLKKTDIEKLKIKDLENRIKQNQEIKEIIIAINPTSDGEATSLYLQRLLEPYNKKITRLGRGLPVGGELEYADEETLSSAFENRK
jgi:recombination protein RecR